MMVTVGDSFYHTTVDKSIRLEEDDQTAFVKLAALFSAFGHFSQIVVKVSKRNSPSFR